MRCQDAIFLLRRWHSLLAMNTKMPLFACDRYLYCMHTPLCGSVLYGEHALFCVVARVNSEPVLQVVAGCCPVAAPSRGVAGMPSIHYVQCQATRKMMAAGATVSHLRT